MIRLSMGVTTCVAAAAAVIAFGAPASAKDWSAAFPPGSDIPKSLGAYDTKPIVEAGPAPKGGWYPCSAFTLPAAKSIVDGIYAAKSDRDQSIDTRAYVYPTSVKAEQAYQKLQAKLSTCNGQVKSTFGESGPNTMKTTTTSGTLDDLTITGVPSVYTYAKTVPLPGAGKPQINSGGAYTVLTLVNDAILMTTASQTGEKGYTTAQQAAVVDFASDFEETWVLAND